jgi:hypothetical protein
MNGNVSRILAFDPGEVTGIAYLADDELMWVTSAAEPCFSSEIFIRSLAAMTKPTIIVLETPPTQTPHHNQAQIQIYNRLLSFYQTAGYRTVTINPGLWKGFVARTKFDASHVKDAADIARFVRQRERKKEDAAKSKG